MTTTTLRGDEQAPLPPDAAVLVDFDALLRSLSADNQAYALTAPWLFGLLLGLRGRCGGALAIVTARRLAAVDRVMSPVMLAGIGQQGAEVRLTFNHPAEMRADAGADALDQALHGLLATPPFAGRVPIYVSDEAGAGATAQLVQALGGRSVTLRSGGMDTLRYWLRERRARPRVEQRVEPRAAIPPAVLQAQKKGARFTAER